MSKHPVSDARIELLLGVALFVAGAYLVHDSYEGRNRKRPFVSKLLLPV